MRIDLEVLHSFDLIIETSTRDNECNSECVKTREIKRRQERRQDEMTGEQETWNASTGRTTRVDHWSEARGPSTTTIHTLPCSILLNAHRMHIYSGWNQRENSTMRS